MLQHKTKSFRGKKNGVSYEIIVTALSFNDDSYDCKIRKILFLRNTIQSNLLITYSYSLRKCQYSQVLRWE